VRYTFEYILADKGSNVSMFRSIAKVEATDRYTVRFTLKSPLPGFRDMIASPMAGAIIARECVDKFGDLKKAEAVVGTGPWMLDSYRPNVGLTLVRNPQYFMAGPTSTASSFWWTRTTPRAPPPSLPASTTSAGSFPAPSTAPTGSRLPSRSRSGGRASRWMESPSNVVNDISLRSDKPPYNDVRVRQAICLAMDRKACACGFSGLRCAGLGGTCQ
jgi:peptide/nickel transport system substrate-binding protein